MPFWAFKDVVKEYLEKVNENEKVRTHMPPPLNICPDSNHPPFQILEYTLFQPGLFLNYLASPHKTSQYITPLDTFIDIHNHRAIIIKGHEDAILTLTTTQDIAAVVTHAVSYNGEWPKVGGIRGNRVTISQILKIGEKLRGRYIHPSPLPIPKTQHNTNTHPYSHNTPPTGHPFTIALVTLPDLQAGNLNTPWTLAARHPSFTDAEADHLTAILKTVLIGTLLSSQKGAWDVSDEWNQRLPEYKFTEIEAFLAEVWEGRP